MKLLTLSNLVFGSALAVVAAMLARPLLLAQVHAPLVLAAVEFAAVSGQSSSVAGLPGRVLRAAVADKVTLSRAACRVANKQLDATWWPSSWISVDALLPEDVCLQHVTSPLRNTTLADAERVVDRMHRLQQEDQQTDGRAAVVVGAGPGGLLTALAAALEGLSVTVVERRGDDEWASRNVWFDLHSESVNGSPSQSLLREWGFFDTPGLMVQRHPHTDIISVRCADVERFAAKTLAGLGASFRFAHVAVGVCDSHLVALPTSAASPGASQADLTACQLAADARSSALVLPFDVLVVSDGARSRLRRHLNASFDRQATFVLERAPHPALEVRPARPVRQTTLILRFAATATNGTAQCPPLHDSDDPFAVQWRFPGTLTVVFKRFFDGGLCELQILFTARAGDALLEGSGDGDGGGDQAVPWPLLLDVSNHLFKPRPGGRGRAFASIQELKRALIDGPAAVSLFPVDVRRANPVVSTFPRSRGAPSRVLITGDAAITALYRLGTGVNFVLAGLTDVRRVLKRTRPGVASLGQTHGEWAAFQATLDRRLARMAGDQALTIFFEAQCGLVVFERELWKLQRDGRYREVSYDEALRACAVAVPLTTRERESDDAPRRGTQED